MLKQVQHDRNGRFARVQILDELLQKDLQRILAIYLNAKYTDRKNVKIQTVGKGERNMKIGYLIEMPIWKTSYRLILGDDVKPYLQGWAIVENPTDEDWNNIYPVSAILKAKKNRQNDLITL